MKKTLGEIAALGGTSTNVELTGLPINPAHNANVTHEELRRLVRPRKEPVWACDCALKFLAEQLAMLAKDFGALNMEPDFQRGHVWTPEQQLKFCEAFIRKAIPAHLLTFQFNSPYWNDPEAVTDLPRQIQCVDGLQRITALWKMLAGDILPFGVHVVCFDGSEFSVRRLTCSVRIAVHNFTKKADLLAYYLDLNEGATPHTEEELARVKRMLLEAKEKV